MKVFYYQTSRSYPDTHVALENFLANNPAWVHRGSVTRSDGYIFHIIKKPGSPAKIFAGCKRGYSIARARKYIKGYVSTAKRRETRLILDQLERLVTRCKFF